MLASILPLNTNKSTSRLLVLICLLAGIALAGGCKTKQAPQVKNKTSQAQNTVPVADSQPADWPAIVFLGDSLTAGYGLPSHLSYPSLIENRMKDEGYQYRVINAGISGDTTAGGLSRTKWLLRNRPQIVVLALGANDGLRGRDPKLTRENLSKIIVLCQQAEAEVLLAGMKTLDNFGKGFADEFADIYPSLAREHRIKLMPFLLKGVALRPAYNQADGIHPNAKGSQLIADNMWQGLKTLLKKP